MSINSFAYLQNTAFLGGVATGCLKLYADGGTQFAGLAKSSSRKAHPGEHTDPLSFAVCVRPDDESTVKGAVLKDPIAEPDDAARALPHAPIRAFHNDFPFTTISYADVPYGVYISLCAFNPTLLHNSIDSGIPAAFFEVTLTNPTDKALTVTLGLLLRSSFEAGMGVPLYDKTSGAFFMELCETAAGVPAKRRGSIGLASDAADFTYEISAARDYTDFFSYFCSTQGFLPDKAVHDAVPGLSALLSLPIHLAPGECQTRRFLAVWSFPYCAESPAKSGEKNYYCHYFSDLSSCASYCFTHFDRLRRDSSKFRELIRDGLSHLPTDLANALCTSLATIKDPAIRRDSAGILKGLSEDAEEGTLPISFALEVLFPGITGPTSVWILNRQMNAKGRHCPSAFDAEPTCEQAYARLRMVLRLFYAYRSTSELRFYTENWVDISSMLELLCAYCERHFAKAPDIYAKEDTLFDVLLPTLHAMICMAELLRDKKRKNFFEEKLAAFRVLFDKNIRKRCEEQPLRVLSSSFTARFLAGYALYTQKERQEAASSALSAIDLQEQEPDFFACAELATLKQLSLCEAFVKSFIGHVYSCKKELYGALMQFASLLYGLSGFHYDKNEMTLIVSPAEALCDGYGVFKSFVSFDGAYGRIELGPDYTELILYTGEVKVRRVICSHRPYKVLYGGRLWPCDIDPGTNTVILDSNLAVGKTKKLTILMDLTK